MKNKQSILYITNVPWGWIKQRPHFLAEHLSSDFDVTFFQQHFIENPFKKSVLVNDDVLESDSFRLYNYFLLPYKDYFPNVLISLLNWLIVRILCIRLRYRYDVVWYASPMVYKNYKFLAHKGRLIVYDCMDDYLEFPEHRKDSTILRTISEEEKELLIRADLTLFSAEYLRNKILSRYELKVNNIVVNNAIELPNVGTYMPSRLSSFIQNLQKPFVYIGTVAEWFDFHLIIEVLEQNPEINFVIVGPKLVSIPSHKRLHYLGPIEHDQVYSIIDSSYALVMPFVVDELIRSVNPVKLYEYIYSGKPVVAVKYEETVKFSDFVYLYDSIKEFNEIVQAISVERRSGDFLVECKKFAESNTWSHRCELVSHVIKELL